MKALIFAALAAVSLFSFAPSVSLAQDDSGTMEKLDDGGLGYTTLVGVIFPETGSAVIEYRHHGKIYACPEKDMKVAKFMATFKPGARTSMLSGALDDCLVVDTK